MEFNDEENEKQESIIGQKIKKMVKGLIIKALLVIVPLLLIAGFVVVIIDAALDALSAGVDNLGNSYVAIDSSGNLEGGINITDEQIEQLVQILEQNGMSVENLFLCGDINYDKDADDPENIAQRNKYLRQFLLAELCTLYPDFGITEDETHYNGIIKIKRAPQDSDGTSSTDMEYIRKDIFDAMITSLQNNSLDDSLSGYTIQELQSKIKNLYTIDNAGNLYFATWSTIETNGETIFSVSSKAVNYRKTVEKFGMPIEVPLALCFTSQNPEYVYQFIEEHVLNGEIVITIQDTQRLDTYESWYDYSIKTTEETIIPAYIDEYGVEHEEINTTNSYDTEYNNQNTLESVRTTIDGVAQITSVDTWMITETVSYTNTQGKIQYPLGEETVTYENVDFPGEFPEDSSNTYPIGTVVETVNKSYSLNWCNFTEKEKIVYNEWERNTINVDTADIEEKAKSIIEQWDIPYRIPNTDRKEAAGENIVIGDQILLKLLDKEATQKHEEIFRYLLYLYTGKDYGVTSLDLSIFSDLDFTTIGRTSVYGSTAEEKVWFTLREAGFSEYAVAGVMGNIYAESGFDPAIIEGGNGIGFGLCQWSYGRRTQLEAYAASKGKDASDINTQVEFLLTEITPGATGPAQGYASYQLLYYNGYNGDMWKSATTPEDAAVAFCWSFERPGIPRMSVRTQKAREYYEEYKGKTRPTFSGETITAAGYEFPHYYQRDWSGAYGTSTIASSGCGPTSLAMILAGLTGDTSITPQTVVDAINDYWPNGAYYVPGVGSSHCIFRSDFLQKYFGVTSEVSYPSESQVIAALEQGCGVIGGEDGHILAIVPAPDEYKAQGYKFYIIDSARGHNGPFKSVAEANRVVDGSLRFIAIIKP